jgi:hypothetical protein
MKTARFGKRGQQAGGNLQGGSVEVVEVYLRHDQSGRNILSCSRYNTLLVIDALPSQPARDRNGGVIIVR